MTGNLELLIISNHGVYIPQLFAKEYGKLIVNKKDLKEYVDILLSGPEDEYYDESWCNVLDNAIIENDEGRHFFLDQNDGDLWAIPEEDREEYYNLDAY